MSAKKPRFKPRFGWAVDKSLLGGGWISSKIRLSRATHRVRVTDARDLTAEQAVQKVIQALHDDKEPYYWSGVEDAAKSAGMTARVINGKVKVRRIEE